MGKSGATLEEPSEGGWDLETSGFPAQPLASLPSPPGPGVQSSEWWAEDPQGTSGLGLQVDLGLESWVWHEGLQPMCLCPGDLPLPPEVGEDWSWVEGLETGGWDSGSGGRRPRLWVAPSEQVVVGEGTGIRGRYREVGICTLGSYQHVGRCMVASQVLSALLPSMSLVSLCVPGR